MSKIPTVAVGTLPPRDYLLKCRPAGILGYGRTVVMNPRYHRREGEKTLTAAKDLILKCKQKHPDRKYHVVFNMFDNDSRFGPQPYFTRVGQNSKGRHWHYLKHRIGEPVGFHNWYYLTAALRKYGELSFEAKRRGILKTIKEMTDDEVRRWVVFRPRTTTRCKLVGYSRTHKLLKVL